MARATAQKSPHGVDGSPPLKYPLGAQHDLKAEVTLFSPD